MLQMRERYMRMSEKQMNDEKMLTEWEIMGPFSIEMVGIFAW